MRPAAHTYRWGRLLPALLVWLAGCASIPEQVRELPHDGVHVSRGTCDALHLTENTWMKKRGVRTHEWKLIVALEPDLHGFPPVELYHLSSDPGETRNVAREFPDVVARLRAQMNDHVAARCADTGLRR